MIVSFNDFLKLQYDDKIIYVNNIFKNFEGSNNLFGDFYSVICFLKKEKIKKENLLEQFYGLFLNIYNKSKKENNDFDKITSIRKQLSKIKELENLDKNIDNNILNNLISNL